MIGHGVLVPVEPPTVVWLADDPALGLVHADMHAWSLAHPCECEGVCECEEPE